MAASASSSLCLPAFGGIVDGGRHSPMTDYFCLLLFFTGIWNMMGWK